MTTSCRQTPTATRTDVIQTFTETTTFTTVTTTLPGDVSTSIFSTCLFQTGLTTCVPFVSTILITETGPVTVTQIPLTTIADIETTITTTLFGSTCTTISGSVQSPISPGPGPSKSSSTVSSSTLTTPTSSSTAAPALNTSSEKKFPATAVAGGVVGGLVMFAALVWLGWKFLHKSIPAKYTSGHEDPKKTADNDSFNKEEAYVHQSRYNPPQNSPQCEPQNAANNTNAQQIQTQEQDNNQWDRHRLPKRAEEKLKEKIDEYMNTPSAGQIASGVATVPTPGYQEQNNTQNVPPPTNLGYDTGEPNYVPMPSPVGPQPFGALPQTSESGQYNVTVPGQVASYGQPSLYRPQNFGSSQYRGYAEPSSSSEYQQTNHPYSQ